MMKNIGMSLAVFALLTGAQAAEVSQKDEDLFTDDAAQSETLASIASSEKEHSSTFHGLNPDGQHEVLAEKSGMVFKDDEFQKNEKIRYDAFLQIGSEVAYKQPRPIGEILAQISSLPSAADSGKLLAGSQLNDMDDAEETLSSLRAAESVTGMKMSTPEHGKKFFKENGTNYQNLLKDNGRIFTSELQNILNEDEIRAKHQREEALAQKNIQKAQVNEHKEEKKAEDGLAIHFRTDSLNDLDDSSFAQESESSSSSSD